MNRKTFFFAVIAGALSGQAVAQTPTGLLEDFVSTLSREAVQADLVAFKQAGVNPWSGTYNPLKNFVSARSRDDVTAEYIAARAAADATHPDDAGSAWRAIAVRSTASGIVGSSR